MIHKAYMALLAVQFIFSGYQLLGKAVLGNGTHPLIFAMLRELGASCVFLAGARWIMPVKAWPHEEHLPKTLFAGILLFGGVLGMLFGISLTSPASVALLQPTMPVFALIIAACLGQERLTWRKTSSVTMCCLGAFVIVVSRGDGLDGSNQLGAAVIIGQCLMGAMFTIQQRSLLDLGYSPLAVTASAYCLAAMMTILTVGLWFVSVGPPLESLLPSDPSDLFFFAAVITYAVLFSTVTNYLIMAWASQHVGAVVVTLFSLLQGPFTAAGAWLLYSRSLADSELLGGAAIVLGLILSTEPAFKPELRELTWCEKP